MKKKTVAGKRDDQAGMRGFTLVELCIVIIISGLIFSALFQLYTNYLSQRKISLTRDNITTANGQIGVFLGSKARFPCPADRARPAASLNFGQEAGGGLPGGCTPGMNGVPAIGACSASGGICVVPAPAGRAPYGDSRDAVIIGALPVSALNSVVSNDIAFDGWDRQYLYAVTVGLTDTINFKFNNGTLNAVDEFGNATAGITNDGHYVILSHGPDGNGAWTRAGVRYSNCGIIGSTKDAENCDDTNATFMQAIINSNAVGANHFDDYVYFMKSQASAIWALQNGTSNIFNLNTGKTGIGTSAPTAALDVEGVVTPSTKSVLRAANLTPASPNATLATQICKKDGTRCFNISAISGSTMPTCGGNNIINGLQTVAGVTAPVCAGGTFHPIRPNAACAAGQWVNAIDSDGNVYCK